MPDLQPLHGTVLRGSWRPGVPVFQRDELCDGIYAEIRGEKTLSFRQTRPGLHPLYYAFCGDYVHWDEREWSLHRKIRALGQKNPRIALVEGGDTVTVSGKSVTVAKDPYPRFENHYPANQKEAQRDFASRLLFAVSEIYQQHDKGRVALLLSGGVDSIAVAWALKHAKADVLCITAGRDENDFDPKWARLAAEYFGFDWRFVALPETSVELQSLLDRTILHIEQTSYSNVLMGLCCELIRDAMLEDDRHIAYTGFWGDLLFGHKLQVTGSFNKLPPEQQTDENWTRQRVEHCWHTKPHTLQLAKGLRAGGRSTWRVPFLHPAVVQFAAGLPLDFAPAEMNKPLLYGLMDEYVPRSLAAWHVMQKIGFYTGSGAGKIRLKNPVLQDPNIRATYKRLKQAHS